MCGLIGLVSKNEKQVFTNVGIQMFKELLTVGVLRGINGTGIAAIKQDKIDIVKDACLPPELFNKGNFWEKENKLLMGHNRRTTHGKNIKEDTHPFQEGDITLIHNGMIKFHKRFKNVDVDSHAICHGLNESKEVKPFIERLEGAYALLWYNQKEKAFYAVRNKERPLFLIETASMLVFVSEKEMAQWVLTRNNIAILSTREIKENTIFKYFYKNEKLTFSTIKYSPIESTFLPVKWQGYDNDDDYCYPSYAETEKERNLKIAELKLETGVLINIIPYKLEKLSYQMWGTYNWKWKAYLADDESIDVDFYTNSEEQLEGVYKVAYRSSISNYSTKTFYFNAQPPLKFISTIEEYKLQKEDDILREGVITKNEVYLEPKEIKKLIEAHTECCICHTDMEIETLEDAAVYPLIENGYIMGYEYYCPSHYKVVARRKRKEYKYA